MDDRESVLQRVKHSLKDISKSTLPNEEVFTIGFDKRLLVSKMKSEWERNGSFFHDLTQSTDWSIDFMSYLNSSFQKKRIAISDLSKELIPIDKFEKEKFEYIENQFDLATVDVSICVASVGIAENGTVLVHWEEKQSRSIALLPEWVVFLLPISKLVATMDEAFDGMRANGYNGWVMISGPSRTADIEKVLVTGVHGPKFVSLLIVQ